MRVLLDTNILARSAGPTHGLARELVHFVTQHQHRLLLSPFLVTELSRVLRYERVRQVHGYSDDEIDQFVADMMLVAEMVISSAPFPMLGLSDPDDELVVQAAIAGQADVICTLDRHLLQPSVMAYCKDHGVRVVNDIELLTELRQIDSIS
jgi:uncharacterized protein